MRTGGDAHLRSHTPRRVAYVKALILHCRLLEAESEECPSPTGTFRWAVPVAVSLPLQAPKPFPALATTNLAPNLDATGLQGRP